MIEDFTPPQEFDLKKKTYRQIPNPNKTFLWQYFQLYDEYCINKEKQLEKTKKTYALSILCQQLNEEIKILKYTHPTTSNLHNYIEAHHVDNIKEADRPFYQKRLDKKEESEKKKEDKKQPQLNFNRTIQRPLQDLEYYKKIYAEIVLMQCQDQQIISLDGRQGFTNFFKFAFSNFQPFSKYKIRKGILFMADIARSQMVNKFLQLDIQQGPYTVGQDYTSVGGNSYQNTFIQFVDKDQLQLYNVTLGCTLSKKRENFSGVAFEQRKKLKRYNLISEHQFQKDTYIFQDLQEKEDIIEQKKKKKQEEKAQDEYDPQEDDLDQYEQDSNFSLNWSDQNSEDEQQPDSEVEEIQNIENKTQDLDPDEDFIKFTKINKDIDEILSLQEIEQHINSYMSQQQTDYINSKQDIDSFLLYLSKQNQFIDPVKQIFSTADRFSANKKANEFVYYIQGYISCINHMLNNSCVAALNECKTLIPLLNKINQIGNFFRQSTLNNRELKKQFAGSKKDFVTLKKLNKTRWWSIVGVLDSFLKMESTIQKFNTKTYPKIQQNSLSQDEVIDIGNLLPLLKKIQQLSKFFEANNSRCSFIIPMYYMFESWCKLVDTDSAILQEFKENFFQEMEKRLNSYYLESQKLKDLLCISTFLDPNVSHDFKTQNKDDYLRARQLVLMETIENSLYNDYVNNQLNNEQKNNQQQLQNNNDDHQQQENQDQYQNTFGINKKKKLNSEGNERYSPNSTFLDKLYILKDKLNEQLLQYEHTCNDFKIKVEINNPPYDFATETDYNIVNITQFWKKQISMQSFLDLIQISRKYQSLHCSSAQCERNFSNLAYILNKYRNSLDSSIVDAQIILKQNINNNFLDRQKLKDQFVQEINVKNWEIKK